MFSPRLWIAAALLAATGMCSTNSQAAEPASLSIPPLRLKLFLVRPGDPEIVQTGQLSDTATVDRLIVLFLGTGAGKLTVVDADSTGDTIQLTGTLLTAFPATFDVTATSPNQIQQNLLVTWFGVMTADIKYANIVNTVPATYFFKLKF